MIYLFFKPLDISQKEIGDIPVFEINSFTVLEFDNERLITVMQGDKAIKYDEYYVVEGIDFTDNSRDFISNMSANSGFYGDNILELDGDVIYTRDDGLIFKTQKATYDKNIDTLYSSSDFILFRDNDEVVGTSFKYNNVLNTLSMKNIVAKYQLKEKK